MHRLYDYGPSLNCWKVRELFRRLGRELELVPVSIFEGESQSAEFLAMNPTGSVPVLKLTDGTAIAESNAILCVAAEGTSLFPRQTRDRARVLQWLFFEQNYLEPSLGSLQYWTRTGKLAERHPAVVAFQRERAIKSLAALDRGLAGRLFLAGELTIADIALYAYGHTAEAAGLDPAPFGHYLAWRERFATEHGPLAEIVPYSADPASSSELPS